MKVKFNKFERLAGIFVIVSFFGAIALGFGIAIKRGWLSSKIKFNSVLENAEGIHVGTSVKISGLQAGEVYAVDLVSADKVVVRFEVLEKFHKQIRKDSHVMVVRPFIIGDKVIDVSVGSAEKKRLRAGDMITMLPTYDIMDLMSGRKLGPFVDNLEKMMGNLQVLVEAFSERKRTESMVRMFDELEPLVKNMNIASVGFHGIAHAMNRKKNMIHVMNNMTNISNELNKVLPGLKEEVPNMGRSLGRLMNDLEVLAREFKKLTPAIAAVAPELPRASRQALVALDEIVISLKALQSSFLFSNGAEKARNQELDKLVEERKLIVKERKRLENLQRGIATESNIKNMKSKKTFKSFEKKLKKDKE